MATTRFLRPGATTPIEMMYFSASSTVMSSSMVSERGTMRKKPEVSGNRRVALPVMPGAKGVAIGLYSSVQFLGTFVGAALYLRRDLVQLVRACAHSLALLVCVEGLASYVTAFARVFRDPVRTSRAGRPRLVPTAGLPGWSTAPRASVCTSTRPAAS